MQEALEIAGIVAVLVAARRALRAAPLATLAAAGLAGLVLSSGVLDLSGLAVARRADSGSQALAGWQDRQAGRIACRQRARHALLEGSAEALESARRSCAEAR